MLSFVEVVLYGANQCPRVVESLMTEPPFTASAIEDFADINIFNPEMAREFGLSEEEAARQYQAAALRLVAVIGDDACGGSGVIVRQTDGSDVVLTAKHVCLSTAASGQITIAFLGYRQVHTFRPLSTWLHPTEDIGLIRLPTGMVPGRISVEEYRIGATRSIATSAGAGVLSCGLPGEGRLSVDLVTRTIRQSRFLLFWTDVTGADDKKLRLRANGAEPLTPTSYAGMSGGPVFDRSGCLIGINLGEEGVPLPTTIHALRTRCIENLADHRALRPIRPDPTRTPVEMEFELVHRRSGMKTPMRVNGEYGSNGCALFSLVFRRTVGGEVVLRAPLEMPDWTSEVEPMARLTIESALRALVRETGYMVR